MRLPGTQQYRGKSSLPRLPERPGAAMLGILPNRSPMPKKQKTASRTQTLSAMAADASLDRAARESSANDRGVGDQLSGRSREAADSSVEFPEPCAMPEQWRNATLWQQHFTRFSPGCQPSASCLFSIFSIRFLANIGHLARRAHRGGDRQVARPALLGTAEYLRMGHGPGACAPDQRSTVTLKIVQGHAGGLPAGGSWIGIDPQVHHDDKEKNL